MHEHLDWPMHTVRDEPPVDAMRYATSIPGSRFGGGVPAAFDSWRPRRAWHFEPGPGTKIGKVVERWYWWPASPPRRPAGLLPEVAIAYRVPSSAPRPRPRPRSASVVREWQGRMRSRG